MASVDLQQLGPGFLRVPCRLEGALVGFPCDAIPLQGVTTASDSQCQIIHFNPALQ